MATLEDFSEDELIEELARRRNARQVSKPDRWCCDCANFRYWKGRGEPPDDYNPCQKKHVMEFVVPEDYCDEDYGYYRRVCADRTEIVESTIPESPQPKATKKSLRSRMVVVTPP